MKKLLISLVSSVTLLGASAAWACEGEHGSKVQEVNLQDGAKLKKGEAVFVDANGAETRSKFGVIPGAVLLTSYAEYNPALELPATKDQKLVFYCANTQCQASHEAAKKALGAGYTNVAVLPDGIMGWKKAGLPTAKPGAKEAKAAEKRS